MNRLFHTFLFLFSTLFFPSTCELTVGKQKFWVSPNATKHMEEYITKNIPAYIMPMDSKILLSTFEAAAKQAIAKGVIWKKAIVIHNWELVFGLPKEEGLLPTIFHALFKPNGW